MHHNGVLHRDIKAANLLVNKSGELKIADWGLARSFDGTRDKYTTKVITLWYRPPELLLGSEGATTKTCGECGEVCEAAARTCRTRKGGCGAAFAAACATHKQPYDKAIDIWSCACLFGEMLLKRPLMRGTTELEQLSKIWKLVGTPTAATWPGHDKLPIFKQLNTERWPIEGALDKTLRDVPKMAKSLLVSMLALNPANRLSAAAALDHDYFWTPGAMPPDPSTLILPSKSSNEWDSKVTAAKKAAAAKKR